MFWLRNKKNIFNYVHLSGGLCFLFVLALKAPIATKVVCFSVCLNVLEVSMTNRVDLDQTAPIGAV